MKWQASVDQPLGVSPLNEMSPTLSRVFIEHLLLPDHAAPGPRLSRQRNSIKSENTNISQALGCYVSAWAQYIISRHRLQ